MHVNVQTRINVDACLGYLIYFHMQYCNSGADRTGTGKEGRSFRLYKIGTQIVPGPFICWHCWQWKHIYSCWVEKKTAQSLGHFMIKKKWDLTLVSVAFSECGTVAARVFRGKINNISGTLWQAALMEIEMVSKAILINLKKTKQIHMG